MGLERVKIASTCYGLLAGVLEHSQVLALEGSKNWRSTPYDLEERKNSGKTQPAPPLSSPPYPRHHAILLKTRVPVSLLPNRMFADSGEELNLRNLRCGQRQLALVVVQRRAKHTLSKNCTCGNNTASFSVEFSTYNSREKPCIQSASSQDPSSFATPRTRVGPPSRTKIFMPHLTSHVPFR